MSKRILADGFLPSQNSLRREASRDAGQGPERDAEQERAEKLRALRLQRQLVPLHAGFGFGAEAIKVKSQGVARAAQQRKNQRLVELLNEPLGSGGSGEALVNARNEAALQAAEGLGRDVVHGQGRGGHGGRSHGPAFLDGLSPESDADYEASAGAVFSAPKNTSQASSVVESAQSVQGTGRVPLRPTKPEPVSRAEAFCAWAVDFLFAASVTFISSLAGRAYYLLKGETLFALLVRKFRLKGDFLQNLAPEYQALVAVLALALLFVWIVQTVSALFTRSTLGGFVVGVTAAPRHSRFASGVVFGTIELASLGGLLKLPFVLAAPQVTPLATWMKLEKAR